MPFLPSPALSVLFSACLRRTVGLVLALVFLSAPVAWSTPTDITVRVLSRDAKFVGSGMGGASVILRDADSGEVLARGVTSGATGDTAKVMHDGRGRRALMADADSAAFKATLDLAEPRRITAEVFGPRSEGASGHAASATQWVVPGKHLSGGDGWVIELPGFVVDILRPPGQNIRLAEGERLAIDAQVVMMCGCPTEPGGRWNADEYEIGLMLQRAGDGEAVIEMPMDYAGRSSHFRAEVAIPEPGPYTVTVYAWHPRTGNTGVDRSSVIIQ
jgi:hypothetical protein